MRNQIFWYSIEVTAPIVTSHGRPNIPLWGDGSLMIMKVCDETICGLVTSSLIVSMTVEVSSLNLVKTSALRWIVLSRPIFWMTDSCSRLTKLPLSTMTLSTMASASCTEITRASSWGKSTPSVSCLVKPTIGPGTDIYGLNLIDRSRLLDFSLLGVIGGPQMLEFDKDFC